MVSFRVNDPITGVNKESNAEENYDYYMWMRRIAVSCESSI